MASTPNPAGRVSAPDIEPPRGGVLLNADAAAYIGRSERFVKRLADERRIPHLIVGNRRAFYRDDLDAFLASCEVPARESR